MGDLLFQLMMDYVYSAGGDGDALIVLPDEASVQKCFEDFKGWIDQAGRTSDMIDEYNNGFVASLTLWPQSGFIFVTKGRAAEVRPKWQLDFCVELPFYRSGE